MIVDVYALSHTGLTCRQAATLAALIEARGAPVKFRDIRERIRCCPASFRGVADKLIGAGLAREIPPSRDDRRSPYHALTPAGEALMEPLTLSQP